MCKRIKMQRAKKLCWRALLKKNIIERWKIHVNIFSFGPKLYVYEKDNWNHSSVCLWRISLYLQGLKFVYSSSSWQKCWQKKKSALFVLNNSKDRIFKWVRGYPLLNPCKSWHYWKRILILFGFLLVLEVHISVRDFTLIDT